MGFGWSFGCFFCVGSVSGGGCGVCFFFGCGGVFGFVGFGGGVVVGGSVCYNKLDVLRKRGVGRVFVVECFCSWGVEISDLD